MLRAIFFSVYQLHLVYRKEGDVVLSIKNLLTGQLKIRHLVLVTTVAETGTLVAAAEKLHLTQPAVTRGLREIEEVFGTELFDRHPRGVRANEYGMAIIDRAHLILNTLQDADTQISQLKDRSGHLVRIGTNMAGASLLIPNAIVELKRKNPRTLIHIFEETPDKLASLLSRGEIDLLVGRFTEKESHLTQHIPLYDEPVRLVVRRDHPLLATPGASMKDLLTYPWILPDQQSSLRSELEAMFSQHGLNPPSNIVECSTMLTIRHILLHTDSIAPLPMLVTASDSSLALLPQPLEAVPRQIVVTLMKGVPLNASSIETVNALTSAARQIDATLLRH